MMIWNREAQNGSLWSCYQAFWLLSLSQIRIEFRSFWQDEQTRKFKIDICLSIRSFMFVT